MLFFLYWAQVLHRINFFLHYNWTLAGVYVPFVYLLWLARVAYLQGHITFTKVVSRLSVCPESVQASTEKRIASQTVITWKCSTIETTAITVIIMHVHLCFAVEGNERSPLF